MTIPFAYTHAVAPFLASPITLIDPTTTDALAVGAFIFSATTRLLLLRRAPTDSHPNKWEVPGGGVDPTDESVLHAVAREVFEEAGLEVTSVDGFPGYTEFRSSKGRRIRKYSFVVSVGEGEVKTDEREHSEARWCTWEDVKGMEVTTEGHRAEMERAFRERMSE